ncbi:MAG: hypothetical protein ACOX2N_04460 [Peptococcia bacterium]|jgi:hypothetical protein
MERLAEIKLTKSLLLIPERVLWKHLPVEEIEKGMLRGKAHKRGLRIEGFENRERQRAYAAEAKQIRERVNW